MRRRNRGFRNKDPRFFDKARAVKKKINNFFKNETKRKLGKKLK